LGRTTSNVNLDNAVALLNKLKGTRMRKNRAFGVFWYVLTMICWISGIQAQTVDLVDLPTFIQQQVDDMMYVEGGSFIMGCTAEQGEECADDEWPAHRVTLGAYFISRYEVTQGLWREVMGFDPANLAYKGCDPCPVDNVSWMDVINFIQAINKKTGLRFRLPTEAEWEYAARGGNLSKGYRYSGSNDIDEVAWHRGNREPDSKYGRSYPVGLKKPNELGIYDMTGNVMEWCLDYHSDHYYRNSPELDPTGPSRGSYRVLRGGSYGRYPSECRVSWRSSTIPDFRGAGVGFRLAGSFSQ
jgi:sulfatase modifying factor 1